LLFVDLTPQLIYLFRKPLVNAATVAQLLDISPRSANELIKNMENLGLLREITGYKRNRIFCFEQYLELFLN